MTASYRHMGGDIYWHTAHLPDEQVWGTLLLTLKERLACMRKGLDGECDKAEAVAMEIINALAEQAKWKRAASMRKAS